MHSQNRQRLLKWPWMKHWLVGHRVQPLQCPVQLVCTQMSKYCFGRGSAASYRLWRRPAYEPAPMTALTKTPLSVQAPLSEKNPANLSYDVTDFGIHPHFRDAQRKGLRHDELWHLTICSGAKFYRQAESHRLFLSHMDWTICTRKIQGKLIVMATPHKIHARDL